MAKNAVSNEIKVGIFIAAGVVLTLLAVLVLGSNDNITSHKEHFTSHFPNVEGLISGAKVVLNGIQVGTVDNITFDPESRDIRVSYNIVKQAGDWIRKDATSEIATQGVLGDKYIALSAGSKDQAPIEDGAEIPSAPAEGLSQFLSRSDQLVESVKAVALDLDKILKSFEHNGRSNQIFSNLAITTKNLASATDKLDHALDDVKLKTAVKSLNSILEKIDNGTGTLGALVNDPSLFDSATSLVGGANRNRIVRNLVRQTIRKSEEEKAAAQKK